MEPTRTVFMHMPEWQQNLFYALTAVCIVIMAAQVWARARVWLKGKPIDWRPDFWGGVSKYVLGQKKVASSRPRSGAPMHLCLFYGFLALTVATTLLAISSYGPWRFHRGLYFIIYEMTFDILGLLVIVGAGWALVRRMAYRPPQVSHNWGDYWALILILLIAVTGYVVEGARMANSPTPWDWSAPVGKLVSGMMGHVSDGAYVWWWWFHVFWVYVFIVLLPRMRLRHIVVGTFTAAGAPRQSMGELKPVSIEEVERTGVIGVSQATQYSRWHLMSLDACMECGRCTEVCPAHNVGKTLDPKRVVQDIRGALGNGASVGEAVTHDALWACTTCNACVEACPVLIRHVDLIVDVRRSLVAEGALSGTPATMLRQTGSTSNAWGAGADTREDWMKGFAVPLARDGAPFDVLFWVGCAGAVDPGAMKTTKAVAHLLTKAGVSFACLGREELCTGDSARRIGDEFLFQDLAQRNVALLAKYGVKTVVTACPHCMNTLKHEYPQFGGHYEVLHHTQLLARLIDDGRLAAARPEAGAVTFHDPCYLARANGESDAPRALLGEEPGLNGEASDLARWLTREPGDRVLAEPQQFAHKTLCCGAGGGRMWMEEPVEQRPGDRRARQLLATGAGKIALGCPFCRIMLDASVKAVSDREVEIADVAEMLREANP
jgi:Fe-S oxidoreductase/nitrate reductase gamma subunit